MPRIILPPDAFDDMPEWCYNTEPDDGREEPAFREYDDFADRIEAERRYDAEERFAGLLSMAEDMSAA